MKQAQEIFDKLWADYTTQNPLAKQVYDLFIGQGEEVLNDHIAFRTFNDPRVNIDVMAQEFIEAGYEYKGSYNFEEKKLNARHYEHKEFRDAPRVFISELRTEEFSSFLQTTIKEMLDKIPAEYNGKGNLIYKGNLWGTPSYQTYLKLRDESEYAAWVYVYGFRANHFTVNINALKKTTTVEEVNQFVEKHGFKINDSGGRVKGTPQELLEQSSTMAGKLPVQFIEGTYEIPSCYYEFAKRYPDTDGKLYSGFIAKSADKIFESTNFYPEK